MTISASAYGSTDDVAALVPRIANSSVVFDNLGPPPVGTRPSLEIVETLINQVSALANSMLANAGFITPIAQEEVKLALDIFVNEEVAAIVEGINGSGRFGPTTKEPGRSRFRIITDDLKMFVESNIQGFTNQGATRIPPSDTTASISVGVIGLDFADHGEDIF